MKTSPMVRTLAFALCAYGTILAGCTTPPARPARVEITDIQVAEAERAAADGTVYGYPLLLSDAARRAAEAAGLPLDTFHHARTLPDAQTRGAAQRNPDILRSTAWIDLGAGPRVLHVPALGRRYCSIALHDGWTDVFVAPSSRSIGASPHTFVLTGPGWTGELPGRLEQIKAPTALVRVEVRTATDGRSDYPEVRRLQDQLRIVPLSARRGARPAAAPADGGFVPPSQQALRAQIEALSPQELLSRMAALMQANPPAAADAPLLERLATIGVRPGRPVQLDALPASLREAVQRGVRTGLKRVADSGAEPNGRTVNGWWSPLGIGNYGTDYLQRAAFAWRSLGASLPDDMSTLSAATDDSGMPLSGGHRYVIHFRKGGEPPVAAFWSLTLYDADASQASSADAPRRHVLGSRDRLRRNRDGSLDLYVQTDRPPRSRAANWLSSPSGRFSLVLRAYWPRPALADGKYQLPPIRRIQ